MKRILGEKITKPFSNLIFVYLRNGNNLYMNFKRNICASISILLDELESIFYV